MCSSDLSAYRNHNEPDNANNNVGFRLVCLPCQATLKTEPLPTPKTEPPLAPEGRLFSESFRLGLAGGWFGACSWFS